MRRNFVLDELEKVQKVFHSSTEVKRKFAVKKKQRRIGGRAMALSAIFQRCISFI